MIEPTATAPRVQFTSLADQLETVNAGRQTANPASPVGDDGSGDPNQDSPLPVLIRATNGKSKEKRAEKLKLSTRVDANALESFYSRYAEICKAGMTTLKPRDRSKRKAKAKKRRGGPNTGA